MAWLESPNQTETCKPPVALDPAERASPHTWIQHPTTRRLRQVCAAYHHRSAAEFGAARGPGPCFTDGQNETGRPAVLLMARPPWTLGKRLHPCARAHPDHV